MGRCKICTDGSLLIKAYTVRQGNLITNEEAEPIEVKFCPVCGDPIFLPYTMETLGYDK